MKSHRIRLRKPWKSERRAEGHCFCRRFGRPTGLNPQTRVWMVLEAFQAAGSVALNGQQLGRLSGGADLCRFDVTERLETRNELVITLETTPSPGETAATSPHGEVFLEISHLAGE